MSAGGYKIRNKNEIHFLTLTVVQWFDVFTRKDYRDIFIDSVKYCQGNKGLLIHGWCVMSNHIHLMSSAINHDLSDIMRDLKKFTSKKIIDAIGKNEHESRKEWMLPIFAQQGLTNSRNSDSQFWIQDNQPKECYSPEFTVQKLNYSSARDYYNKKNCGLLKIAFI
jgi:putative transposase